MAQHYSTSRGNLAQMRYGLGRSEPEISAYSRFDRRGSSILDIFNESPSPKPPASPRRPNRYQKFQDAENGDVDSKPNEKKEVTQPKNEQMRKVLAEHNEFHQSVSDRGGSFTASEEKPSSSFERGVFPNASSSATHTPNKDEKQNPNSPRKGSKFSVVMQNPWRQKNKRRRSGVQMTLGVSTDETEEGSTKDGSNDLGLGSPSGDGKSLLLSPQNPNKDFYTSHEQLFEQQSERKRRFWEFMKSREQLIHYDVFISYNHDSKTFALNLYKTLKHTFKYSVFIDKQLSTKQKLNSALDEALRNTQLVVCVVTEKYSKSKSCCAEISLANNLGLPMIPLVIEDLPPHKQNPKNFWPPEGEMSLPLAPLLYIDFREHKNETIADEKMKELKKRIDANLATAV
ncbi:uncharacterized protein LOC142336837 [Convolutriloba macropyga]|uniref:uncharacterized protein LOC142336837 n=1 Tax=Convolutriloba macropyga TaxID=536237 RepID=UPI003F51BF32